METWMDGDLSAEKKMAWMTAAIKASGRNQGNSEAAMLPPIGVWPAWVVVVMLL